MKRQYLGDAKDSFKWDYHHFLLEALGYSQLQIAWMLTSDDGGTHGNTAPELFPTRPEILHLCQQLRTTRDPNLLYELPAVTGAAYRVTFHASSKTSSVFFGGIQAKPDHVVFLDPDNGFEPECSSTDRHIRYADLEQLMQAIPESTVVTVFQHHRRKKFPDDFARIRERLLSGYSTALYWHSLMFVCLSPSAETMAQVVKVNQVYAQQHPVQVLI